MSQEEEWEETSHIEKDGQQQKKQPKNNLSFKINCCGYREQQKEIIRKDKAKAGTKAVRHALRVQGAMKALEKGVVADLTTGMAIFKRRMDTDKIAELVGRGETDKAMEVIPWDKLPEDLARVAPAMESAVESGARASIAQVPAGSSALIVSSANPAVQRFVRDQVGNLIVGISNESRKSVQNAIFQSFDQALTPRQTANIMKEAVGITEKQSQQVMRKQLNEFVKRDQLQEKLSILESKGLGQSKTGIKTKVALRNLTDDKIEKRTLRFAGRLQKNRNITIARTELTRATNQGQVEVWLAAADEGLIDRNEARKVWVVVPDDRLSDICRDLDGTSVPLDEKFFVAQTGEMVDGPPAHPNCRSALSLKFEEE